MTRNIVIIGNGISGISAARTIREHSEHRITIVSSETPYFISRTALMYAYMGQIQYQDLKPYPDHEWDRMGISLRQDYATHVPGEVCVVQLASGENLKFDDLIIATGSRPNRFGWEGENAAGVQGLYSMQDLMSLEAASPSITRAVVVGGGLIGIELAEMLRSRNIPVTFLVREKSYMDYLLPAIESEMVTRHVDQFGIDFKYETELRRIETDDAGRVRAVTTSDGEHIEADFVGLTAGVHPNVDFARSSDVETARGILIDKRFQTSRPHVWAIGDCAEFRDPLPDGRTIEQLWYSGRRHGQALGRILGRGEDGSGTAYDPGIFFNSAKFFEMEYQTYGRIDANPTQEFRTLAIRSVSRGKLLRIQYDAATKAVVGFNCLGVRFRQDVCENWIRGGALIENVQKNLHRANFDPEFSFRMERTARLVNADHETLIEA